MEGKRARELAAPAWAAPPLLAPAAQGAGAAPPGIYVPRGWKLQRRRQGSDGQGPSKRRKRAASAPVQPAAQPRLVPTAPRPAPNPAQLAPLQCAWPHPAVLHLLAQQAWPAAGTAALVQRTAGPAAGGPPWWDRMLPHLSLPHPPLAPERQRLLQAASSGGGGRMAEPLPQPGVLLGYEDDWLEVAPQVLPMWQATPLAPFGRPKDLLHFLVCPEPQLAQAQQLVKDVGSLFETCCLGSHAPAGGAAAVHAFSLQHPASGTAGEAAAATWRQRPLAARYVAGLRHACEQLQRRLLLDPPAELQEGVGASLEDGSAALVVYLACPLEQPADQVAALLEAAACLAPCTLLGADAGGVAAGLCLDSPGGVQQPQPQQLEPCAPQQPDRPAGATPAADNSRAPGGSPPPDEQDEEEGEVKGQPGSAGAGGQQAAGQQAAEQQRYHGAASVLHEQQQGDFRRLPVLQLQRPEGSSPSNIVLQLLTPQALADLTGTAARCTAFAVYSKAQRQVQPDGSLEQMSLEPGEALPASLPFCSQPLVALASAAAAVRSAQDVQQPAASQQQQSSSEAGPQQRTLHCCYAPPLAGSSLLPLAFTDSCGELVHAELLNSAACGLGLGAVGSRSSGGAAAAGSNAGSDVDSGIPASVVCRAVLQRCIELLASLRAVSGMADALQDLAISAVGMQPSEQEAWRQLLQHDARHDVLQQMGLPQDSCLSVVELQALPPARFAGPDPPSGCLLLLEQQERSHLPQQQACIAWLPPASGSSSLLPQEHDTVRQLEVALVAHSQGPSQGLPYSGAEPLRSVAHDLHGLAWLHAAFQGACLRTLAGGGQPAPADAHLPLHAALATQLHSLLGHACAVSAGRT